MIFSGSIIIGGMNYRELLRDCHQGVFEIDFPDHLITTREYSKFVFLIMYFVYNLYLNILFGWFMSWDSLSAVG